MKDNPTETARQMGVKVAEETGPETVGLVMALMEHNRLEATWVADQVREYDERRIAELEAENAALQAELDGIRRRLDWIMWGGKREGWA